MKKIETSKVAKKLDLRRKEVLPLKSGARAGSWSGGSTGTDATCEPCGETGDFC